MDNWKLEFNDGMELTEQHAQFWDNVPDKEIKQATFTLLNGSKLIFEKFKSICIAKLGVVMFSGENTHTGYRITEIKDDNYNDFIITKDGVKKDTGHVSNLTIPEKCFRRGVS